MPRGVPATLGVVWCAFAGCRNDTGDVAGRLKGPVVSEQQQGERKDSQRAKSEGGGEALRVGDSPSKREREGFAKTEECDCSSKAERLLCQQHLDPIGDERHVGPGKETIVVVKTGCE